MCAPHKRPVEAATKAICFASEVLALERLLDAAAPAIAQAISDALAPIIICVGS